MSENDPREGRSPNDYHVVRATAGRDVVDLTLDSDDESDPGSVNAQAGPSRSRESNLSNIGRFVQTEAPTSTRRESGPAVWADSDEDDESDLPFDDLLRHRPPGPRQSPAVKQSPIVHYSPAIKQSSVINHSPAKLASLLASGGPHGTAVPTPVIERVHVHSSPKADDALGSWTNPRTFKLKSGPMRPMISPTKTGGGDAKASDTGDKMSAAETRMLAREAREALGMDATAAGTEAKGAAGTWGNPTRLVTALAKRPHSPPPHDGLAKRPAVIVNMKQTAKKSSGGVRPSRPVVFGRLEDIRAEDGYGEGDLGATSESTSARAETPVSNQVEIVSEGLAEVDLAAGSGAGTKGLNLVEMTADGGPVLVTDALRHIANMSRKEWRDIVETEGETDVEALLDDERDEWELSGLYGRADDQVVRARSQNGALAQPPPERRGIAIRDFDTKWIDMWNKRHPTLTRNPALHREIFANFLHAADTGAPEMYVYNDVDQEGAPPDLEFQFSNDMLYHRDVPDPELGKGCGCQGPCDPRNQSCSCLRRQEAYYYNLGMKGFAYDKQGILIFNQVPIWECGATCGCPPSCRNRVIQRGRSKETTIDIFKTRRKGWGIRARQAIEEGTFVGIYSGELITEAESDRRAQVYASTGRTYLFDCDGYHIAHPPPGLDAIDPRLGQIAREACARAQDTAMADGIEIGSQEWVEHVSNQFAIDAFHYGNYTRYFNHNCDPNLIIVQAYVKDFHPERPVLAIFTRRDVRKNEELCISYRGVMDPEEEEVMRERNYKAKLLKGRHGKLQGKSAKASAQVKAVSLPPNSKDNVCYCGAAICCGTMFNKVNILTDVDFLQ